MVPENEMGVVAFFSAHCHEAGFRIVKIGTAFPDAIVEKDGVEYRAEFEYKASGFAKQGHDPMKCDLIICWINDDPAAILPVIELSDPNWRETNVYLLERQFRQVFYWKKRAIEVEQILASRTIQEILKFRDQNSKEKK